MKVIAEMLPEMELVFMSYAVVRMQKLKAHDLKGVQFHNQRERESRTNPDIDKERSHENYDLVNDEPIDYNERVKEIIESQKTSKRKTRKDAVLVNELLITSDREFFDGLDPDEQKRFFEESYKFLAERYGKQNIAYAVVHNDEKTPHMHLGVVPMRDGRLQSRNVFNRKELLWLQDNFPKHMQERGFDLERGKKGSDREHLKTQEFKKQTVEKELKEVEKNLLEKRDELKKINEKKQELEKMIEILPDTKEKIQYVRKETKTVKVGFMKTEERETGNYVLSHKQMQDMSKKINAAVAVKKGYERLIKTDLVQENIKLREIVVKQKKTIEELKTRNSNLQKEKTRLYWENESLKDQISILKQDIGLIYESAKEFLRERTDSLKAFKSVFKDFVDKVKYKTTQFEQKHDLGAKMNEFEKIYKQELRKERDRGLER